MVLKKRLVIFLGAGASWDSGLPLGDEAALYVIKSSFSRIGLINIWEEIYNYDAKKNINLWPRFEVVINLFNKYIYNSVIKILDTFQNSGISSTAILLSQIDGPKIWLTTNFDNQIETALSNIKRKYYVFTDRKKISELKNLRKNYDYIFKLHGDSNELNLEQNVGADIEQILKEFPKKSSNNLLKIVKGKTVLFIGYAARDPDLQNFIREVVNVANYVYWIDLGPVKERISRYINSKVKYYSTGSPLALQKIFNVMPPEPIKPEIPWTEKMDACIESFDKQSLLNIVSDLCLYRNDSFSISLLDKIQSYIIDDFSFNTYHKSRRKIQAIFHSPDRKSLQRIENHLNILETIIKNIGDDKLKKEILLFIAEVYRRTSNPEKSIKILDKVLKNFRIINKDQEYINLLILLGISKLYYGSKYFDEAINHLKEAKKKAVSLNFPILKAEASLRLAIALMRGHEPKEAEKELLDSKPIFDEINNPRNLFVWYLNYAESLRIQRKYEKSIKVLTSLIEKAEFAEDIEVLINARGNLGLNQISIGNLIEGDNELKNVINLVDTFGTNKEAKANAIYNRGWLRIICFDWESAVPFLKLAAESYNKDYYSPERRGGALSLLGLCYFQYKSRKESFDILEMIKKENIVPKGSMSSDYKLLEFLHNKFDFEKVNLNFIFSYFENEPEQLFYFFLILLQRYPKNSIYFKHAFYQAQQANINIYFSVLRNHYTKYKPNVEKSIIEYLNKNYKYDYNFLINNLKKN